MLPMAPILDVDRYRKLLYMIVDILLTAMARLARLSGIAKRVHEDAPSNRTNGDYFDSVHQVCCSLAALATYWTDGGLQRYAEPWTRD